jgi:hypothetical protein
VLAISFWESIWLIIVIFFMLMYLMLLFSIIVDLIRDHELSGGMKALWFVALLLFTPITALIYLIVRGGGMAQRNMKEQQQAKAEFDAYVRSAAGTGGAASELAKASELLNSGAISQAEYDALKAKIIG